MNLPRLAIPNGTVEALKWLALLLMTGDHINKYLFNGTMPLLFNAGRLALPLFAFVLAYNLARPGTLERGVYVRAMKRLALFGLLATPSFACGSLWFINGNFWGLVALPLVVGAMHVDLRLPRLRWVFYAYYPLHLAALLLIRIPMSKAGYLFF